MAPVAILALFLSVLITTGTSFMPNTLPVGHDMLDGTITHAEQTKEALYSVIKTTLKIGTLPNSVKTAVQEVMAANANVDADPATKHDPTAHFDDEEFERGQERLMKLRAQTIEGVVDGKAKEARRLLGVQLHAVQDFYAHSNYVEMGRTELSDQIGVVGGKGYPKTEDGVPTCRACRKPPGSITSDYEATIKVLEDSKMPGDTAWATVSSVTMAKLNGVLAAERMTMPQCDTNLLENLHVTSGYYSAKKPNGHPGKCTHGGLMDKGARGTEGINKDTNVELFSPHGPIPKAGTGKETWHKQAVSLAVKATAHYVNQLREEHPETNQAGLTTDQFAQLFNYKPNDVAGVRKASTSAGSGSTPDRGRSSSVGTLLNVFTPGRKSSVGSSTGAGDARRSSNSPAPPSPGAPGASGDAPKRLRARSEATEAYLLTRSADGILEMLHPGFSNKLAKRSREKSERSMHRDEAVAQLQKLHSNSIIITDDNDSAADGSEYEGLLADADLAEHPLRFRFVLPGAGMDRAAPSRRHRYLTAAGAGPASAAKALSQLINADLVALHAQAPNATNAATSSSTTFVCDPATSTLFLRLNPHAHTTIMRPNGSRVRHYGAADDADVSVLTALNARLVAIAAPAPGRWTVSSAPAGATAPQQQAAGGSPTGAFAVAASSRLAFASFDFVEVREGPHPATVSVGARLDAGRRYAVVAEVDGLGGGGEVGAFELRDAQGGDTVARLDLVRDEAHAARGAVLRAMLGHAGASEDDGARWHGTVSVPCGEFYVYVLGRDAAGAEFQRMFPTKFEGGGRCEL